jgi:hypothetical protein
MENRIRTAMETAADRRPLATNDAHPIGEILKELLAQYEARFPGIRIAIVETPATAL